MNKTEILGRNRILIACLSDLESDPRVRRQIEWLADAGFEIDTLGEGKIPSKEVSKHFVIASERPRWLKPRILYAVVMIFLPFKLKFRTVFEPRIPKDVTNKYLSGSYDLVILNDIDLLPWAVNKNSPRVKGKDQKVHLDLHEFHPHDLPKVAHWRFLMNGYWKGLRSYIGSSGFSSRSVVAEGIGELYSQEFTIALPQIVRNVPLYESLEPTPVNPGRIELIHHGSANWNRGIAKLVTAMRSIDTEYHLTLMLTGDPESIVHQEIQSLVSKLELSDRVSLIPPVPMKEVAKAINKYDIEIIFFEPVTKNLELAMPNKLFESIQGRLAIVAGSNPNISNFVTKHGIGKVVQGWEPEDLASSINSLTVEDIQLMKQQSGEISRIFCQESEGKKFLESISI